MTKIKLAVTAFYLSDLARVEDAKMAMKDTVVEHGFKRSTIYKWLKWRRKRDRRFALRGRSDGEPAIGQGERDEGNPRISPAGPSV